MTTLSPRASYAAVFCAFSMLGTAALAASPPLVPVVVSISTNTAQINGFGQALVKRTLPANHGEGMFAREGFAIDEAAPGIARDTRVLIGMLPPGEYSFTSFAESGGRGKSVNVSDSKLLGRFTVKAGTPVDLGRLVLTPVNDKVVIGRAMRSPSNLPILQRAVPDKAPLFASGPTSSWDAPPTEEGKSLETYALSKPVGAECLTEAADGTVYAASRLGTVLIRAATGRWRAVRGPGLESLRCVQVADLPDTDLVAVGELGTMVRRPRGQNVLVPVDTGNLPMGDLHGIIGSAAAGWIVRHQQGNKVTLFRSDKLDGGTWTPVLTNEASVHARQAHNPPSTFMWQTPHGMGYAGAMGEFRMYDAKAGQWRDVALPATHHRVIHVQAAPNGELSLVAASGNPIWNLPQKAFVSRDQGASWKHVSPYMKNWAPLITIANDGTMMAIHNKEKPIKTTRDDGATWTDSGTLEYSAAMLPLRSGTLINAEDGRFGFFTIESSKDMGQTWQNEYSTFNSDAYKAEKAEKAANAAAGK